MSDPGVKVACEAMATRFELLLYGGNPTRLRAAGEEALAEIERVERKLSYFRPDSAVGRINRRAGEEAVRLDPEVYSLLEDCVRFWRETGGAFDITLSPLFEAWGLRGEKNQAPSTADLQSLREKTGTERIRMNPDDRTIRFQTSGMKIDLGGVGKGFGLEAAAESLREAGIENALLHGGTSSVIAMGHPPGEEAWRVAIRMPGAEDASAEHRTVSLRDNSLSVSSGLGRTFRVGETIHSHLFSSESASPVPKNRLGAVICKSATRGDALATGLVAGGSVVFEMLRSPDADLAVFLLSEGEDPLAHGM